MNNNPPPISEEDYKAFTKAVAAYIVDRTSSIKAEDVSLLLETKIDLYNTIFEQKSFTKYVKFAKTIKHVANKKSYLIRLRGPKTSMSDTDTRSLISTNLRPQSSLTLPNGGEEQWDNESLLNILDSNGLSTEEQLKQEAQQQFFNTISLCSRLPNIGERSQMLCKEFEKDPKRFNEHLQIYSTRSSKMENIYSNLINIWYVKHLHLEAPALVAQACAFYTSALLAEKHLTLLQSQIFDIISFFHMKIETHQLSILGFLYCLYNNKMNFSTREMELIKGLVVKVPLQWATFQQHLQDQHQIRREVAQHLPEEGRLFHKDFLEMLKKEQGGLFISVPTAYRRLLIHFAVHMTPYKLEDMEEFVKQLSTILTRYDSLFAQAKFKDFFELANETIISTTADIVRQCTFQNMTEILLKVITLVKEHKIYDCLEMKAALFGQSHILDAKLRQAKEIQSATSNELEGYYILLKKQNFESDVVQAFQNADFNPAIIQMIEMIEKAYGNKLYCLQEMCLKFIMQFLTRRSHFINFGMGNGKTLICTALAIILAKTLSKKVIILGKKEYLPYRDYKNFADIIDKCSLTSSHYDIVGCDITYLPEKRLTHMEQSLKKNIKDHILIMDEFDWILFDNDKAAASYKKILKLQKFFMIIGMSGSRLDTKETQCLQHAFNAELTTFPTIQQVTGENILIHNKICTNNVEDWFTSIYYTSTTLARTVPVIMMMTQQTLMQYSQSKPEPKYNNLMQYLSKDGIDLVKLFTTIEQQFTQKSQDGSYGIYIVDEDLGRGTDFPSTTSIEENGGVYIMITQILSERSDKQVQHRVGRMKNKGQIQYIINLEDAVGNPDEQIKNKQSQIKYRYEDQLKSLLTMLKSEPSNFKTNEQQEQDNLVLAPNQFFQLGIPSQDISLYEDLSNEISIKPSTLTSPNLDKLQDLLGKRQPVTTVTKLDEEVKNEDSLSQDEDSLMSEEIIDKHFLTYEQSKHEKCHGPCSRYTGYTCERYYRTKDQFLEHIILKHNNKFGQQLDLTDDEDNKQKKIKKAKGNINKLSNDSEATPIKRKTNSRKQKGDKINSKYIKLNKQSDSNERKIPPEQVEQNSDDLSNSQQQQDGRKQLQNNSEQLPKDSNQTKKKNPSNADMINNSKLTPPNSQLDSAKQEKLLKRLKNSSLAEVKPSPRRSGRHADVKDSDLQSLPLEIQPKKRSDEQNQRMKSLKETRQQLQQYLIKHYYSQDEEDDKQGEQDSLDAPMKNVDEQTKDERLLFSDRNGQEEI